MYAHWVVRGCAEHAIHQAGGGERGIRGTTKIMVLLGVDIQLGQWDAVPCATWVRARGSYWQDIQSTHADRNLVFFVRNRKGSGIRNMT